MKTMILGLIMVLGFSAHASQEGPLHCQLSNLGSTEVEMDITPAGGFYSSEEDLKSPLKGSRYALGIDNTADFAGARLMLKDMVTGVEAYADAPTPLTNLDVELHQDKLPFAYSHVFVACRAK